MQSVLRPPRSLRAANHPRGELHELTSVSSHLTGEVQIPLAGRRRDSLRRARGSSSTGTAPRRAGGGTWVASPTAARWRATFAGYCTMASSLIRPWHWGQARTSTEKVRARSCAQGRLEEAPSGRGVSGRPRVSWKEWRAHAARGARGDAAHSGEGASRCAGPRARTPPPLARPQVGEPLHPLDQVRGRRLGTRTAIAPHSVSRLSRTTSYNALAVGGRGL
jgi:hypothetical protein